MERINLEQNSPEWLEYRFDHLNASEAGTVMRCNPFQSVEKLREIKLSRRDDFQGNAATEWGHKHEDSAKALAERLLDVELEPAVFRDGYYSASLDAYGTSGNESLKVEIKCPFKKENSHLWRQVQTEGDWTQRIPEYYVWQIVHQEMVCPTTFSYFLVFIPDGGFELIQCFPTQEMIDKLKAGWDAFLDPSLEDQVIDTDEARDLVARRALHKAEKEFAEAALKEVESELKRLAGEANTQFPGGLSLVKRERKGAIDEKALRKAGIDVDQYRRDPVKFMQFTGGEK